MNLKQITITCPSSKTDILEKLRSLKKQYQINISAYCAEAIEQKLSVDTRIMECYK
jgi:hypothetical protein